jgi:RNA polymerase sigma-70 factor, ECF subfamily
MLTLSDEELVRRCKVELPDDTSNFEILVQRHTAKIYSVIYRLMGHREEAEDVTQEVFLKVYNNLKKFELQASFASWVYRIATNAALDALDKQKRRPAYTNQSSSNRPDRAEHDQVEWERYQMAVVGNPEELITQAELRKCIAEVFTRLERDQASVLIMRDVDDFSYAEVAEVTGTGLSAVKMRIYRARLAFQELFKKFCDSAFPKNVPLEGTGSSKHSTKDQAKLASN